MKKKKKEEEMGCDETFSPNANKGTKASQISECDHCSPKLV